MLAENFPDAQLVAFGHVGDGNLHYNVQLPSGTSGEDSSEQEEQVSVLIYDLVEEFGGSISAEHGVGVLKREYLKRYKSDVDLNLMRTLKDALDPQNVLNPGKVI